LPFVPPTNYGFFKTSVFEKATLDFDEKLGV